MLPHIYFKISRLCYVIDKHRNQSDVSGEVFVQFTTRIFESYDLLGHNVWEEKKPERRHTN